MFDQYFKLLKESPYLLKSDGLGRYFLLVCFSNCKKMSAGTTFDIRNKKLCSHRLGGRKKGVFFIGAKSKSLRKYILDIMFSLYFLTLQ